MFLTRKKNILQAFVFSLFFVVALNANACSQLDSTKAIPSGFGASYDLILPGYASLIKTDCSASSLSLEVGNNQSYQYIYKLGYFYRNGAWEPFTFSNATATSDWIIGTASGSIVLTEAERLGTNYVVAYVCTWTGTAWKCGCRDKACATSHWQLQIFKYPGMSCFDTDGDKYDTCSVGDAGDDNKALDCNDTKSAVNPGALEVCDTFDNDCDGTVDEGCDDDKDLYCDSGMKLYGGNTMCTLTSFKGEGTSGSDCDDTNVSVNPGKAEVCDGVDNDCDKNTDEGCVCVDGDKDGYDTCGTGELGDDGKAEDCNDKAWERSPGAVEICDGVDNDCDEANDEGGVCCSDNDGDTYDACSVGADGDDGKILDCDDASWFMNPGAPETCDNYDNNCNGEKDEKCDADGDGYCSPTIRFYNYPVSVCPKTNVASDSFGDDCSATDFNVNPGVAEKCNGIDDDCDVIIDENCSCTNGQTQACGIDTGACRVGSQTCTNGTWGTCTGEIVAVAEVCSDSIDNDCDGQTDEGCSTCVDNDKDSFDNCAIGTSGDDGKVIDCNDNQEWSNPGGIETCDSVDNNCSGVADEGCDDDGDRYCDREMKLYGSNLMCPLTAFTINGMDGNDCDDKNLNVNPSKTEVCGNSLDDNCVSGVDEGCTGQSELSAEITFPEDGYKTTNASSAMGGGFSFSGLGLGGSAPYTYVWSSDLDGNLGTKPYIAVDVSRWKLGDHKITLTVTDSKGKISSKIITVTIVSSSTLFSNIQLNFPAYSIAQKNLFFYAYTSGGTEPYSYSWNSSLQGNFLSTNYGSVDISSWSLGTHKITLTTSDSSGATVVDTKNIDIVKMAAEFYPDDASNFEQMWDVWFNIFINGGSAPYSYSIISDLDGTLYNQNSATVSHVSFSKDNLSLGLHKITFRAQDSSGLVIERTNRVQISPLSPIEVNISSPLNNYSARQGDSIDFKAGSTGQVPGRVYYSWESNRDGVLSSAFNFSINNLSVGTHQITATVTDSKGNSGSSSITVVVTTPPPLAVTIEKPISGTTYEKNDDVIAFSSLSSGGVSPYTYSWSSNIDGVISTTDKFTLNTLSLGTHTITVTAKDAVGATVNKALSLTIKSGCEVNNIKNNSMYLSNEAFMISDGDWRKVLGMVPVTTWKDGKNIYSKPSLIYHEETGKYDADSIINFLQRYVPTRLTTINTTPTGLNDLLVAPKPTGAGLNSANIQNRNDSDYFAYWNSFNTIVVVDYDNYTAGLIASVLASNQNSPIIFVNSANLSTYQSVIDGNKVYTVGDLDATTSLYIDTYSSCRKSFSIEELQKWYAGATNSNKLMLLNPGDNSISFNTTYTTKKSGTVSNIYSKMSLVAPFLAAAKEEVIAFTSLPSAGVNSSCAGSTVIDANVAKADADALYAIQNIFALKPEFLTIVASPLAIPDSKYKSCDGSWQFRTVEDWRYGSVSTTNIRPLELKTGRIYGITAADASAYVARAINFDYLNSKIYNNAYSVITVGHDFEQAMDLAKSVRDKATSGAYSAVCYTGSARENCTTSLRPAYDLYKMKNFMGYLDHGAPYGWWNTLDQKDIPDLDLVVSAGAACLTHNFWQSTNQNFGAHILRRGGIGSYGATGVTWSSGFPMVQTALRELSTDYNATLGGIAQKLELSEDFSLIGDPTLKPKFKSITW